MRKQENKMHKIIRDLEIQIHHPVLARRPDLEFINKKEITWMHVDFSEPEDDRMKMNKLYSRDTAIRIHIHAET